MIDGSICVVIPVYNAHETLETLVEKLITVLQAFREYHIILVDDCSRDSSFDIMKRMHNTYRHITIISFAVNVGQQSALLCGLRHSNSDYTVIIDDDLEHDPNDILKLYERAVEGFDVVYGVCAQQNNIGLFREFGASLRDRLFDKITKKPKNKKVCSFRIMNRQTVKNVCSADTKFVYISLEILKYTVNIENVTVEYCERRQSGYHPGKLILLLIKMYVYYAPHTILTKLRKKGRCYQIRVINHAKAER